MVTTDEVATGRGVDLATQGFEVGGFLQPIVEEEGLIGEGLSADSASVSLYTTEGFGHVKPIEDIPVGAWRIEAMSRTGRIRAEEVILNHEILHEESLI